MKIEISDEIVNKLRVQSKQSNYNSVDEFIEMILKRVLFKLENTEKVLSEDQEKEIKSRLKDFGYI